MASPGASEPMFGCIHPSTIRLPWDLAEMLPAGLQVASTALNVRNGIPGEHERALGDIESAVGVLVYEGVKAIVVYGVPVAARQGFQQEQEQYGRLSRQASVPVVSSLRTVVLRLQDLRVKRPLAVTQYGEEANRQIAAYFADAGLPLLGWVGLDRRNSAEVNATAPEDYERLARRALSDHPAADALFFSARTNLEGICRRLEQETGLTMVHQTRAVLWWAPREIGFRDSERRKGAS